jgi:hypothetical protein
MVQGIAGNRAEQLAAFDARRALAATPRVVTSRGDAPSNPALQQAQANVAETTEALRRSSHGMTGSNFVMPQAGGGRQTAALTGTPLVNAPPLSPFATTAAPTMMPSMPFINTPVPGSKGLFTRPPSGLPTAPVSTQFTPGPVDSPTGLLDISGLEQLLPQISLDTPEGIQIAASLQQLISLIGQSSLLKGNGISTGITFPGGS